MAKMRPLPAQPTLEDIVSAITELHDCIEVEHANILQFRKDVQANFNRLNYIYGIENIKTEDLHKYKSKSQVSYRKMFTTVASSVAAVGVLYKGSIWLWPAIHMIMSQALAGYK